MILVDTSAWIDFLRGTPTPAADKLDSLLGVAPLAIGGLILTEVLQGCDSAKEFNQVRKLLSTFTLITLGGSGRGRRSRKEFPEVTHPRHHRPQNN